MTVNFFVFISIRWSNSSTLSATTPTKLSASRSQPVSPAPRAPTSKLSVHSMRRPASSDGLRHSSSAQTVTESPRRGTSMSETSETPRSVTASRPFVKVKSDSSIPASNRQFQLRHRVTVNGFSTNNDATPNVQDSTRRSQSSANLIPSVAPLADIAEHSTDIDLNRMRIEKSSSDHSRRFDHPLLVINDGRKSLSMTKISVPDKSLYLGEPHIRRNASWTTMTTALNS